MASAANRNHSIGASGILPPKDHLGFFRLDSIQFQRCRRSNPSSCNASISNLYEMSPFVCLCPLMAQQSFVVLVAWLDSCSRGSLHDVF